MADRHLCLLLYARLYFSKNVTMSMWLLVLVSTIRSACRISISFCFISKFLRLAACSFLCRSYLLTWNLKLMEPVESMKPWLKTSSMRANLEKLYLSDGNCLRARVFLMLRWGSRMLISSTLISTRWGGFSLSARQDALTRDKVMYPGLWIFRSHSKDQIWPSTTIGSEISLTWLIRF